LQIRLLKNVPYGGRMKTGAHPPSPDEWLDLPAAAKEVKVSTATLRREAKRGKLRHARIGGRKCIRLRRAWVNEWLEREATPVEVRT
jgi:excisionase family DNA binding protein